MTSKKPPTSRKLVSQKVGPVDKRRRPRGLTKAIRTALDAIIHDRRTRAQACKIAGITERALYLSLEKPEVARYWNGQIEVLKGAERPANIFALCEVRDQKSNQMARVAAVAKLEQLADVEHARPAHMQVLPGLSIVLNVPVPPRPAHIIDHEDIPAETPFKSSKTW